MYFEAYRLGKKYVKAALKCAFLAQKFNVVFWAGGHHTGLCVRYQMMGMATPRMDSPKQGGRATYISKTTAGSALSCHRRAIPSSRSQAVDCQLSGASGAPASRSQRIRWQAPPHHFESRRLSAALPYVE